MLRVRLLGPRVLLPDLLAFLQAGGVLQLRPPRPGEPPACSAPAAAGARAAALEAAAAGAEALAARLEPLARAGRSGGGGPDDRARSAVTSACAGLPAADDLEARVRATGAALAAAEGRRAALLAERDAADRFAALVLALAPLGHGLDPRLEPERHGLVLERDPVALALLEAEVRRVTEGACELRSRPLDARRVGVLVTVPRARGRALARLLFERGVEEIPLPAGWAGRGLVDLLLLLAARTRALPAELLAADAALGAVGEEAPGLRAGAAAARAGAARLRAEEACAETRFACVVTGYAPAARGEALRAAAARAFGDRVLVELAPPPRAEWPDVPVALSNRPAIRPFERLLALVALPRYGTVDPTPWLALFFPLFFGLVLGDLAFGLLAGTAALAVRARTRSPLARDLAAVVLACAAAALLFGLLYGEALGDLGHALGLRPLFDRRNAVLAFLGGALALGAVHVGAGLALGAVSAGRGGHPRAAVARAARLGLLACAAAGAAAAVGLLPPRALAPLAAAGVLLLGVALAAEGPLAALDVVLGAGNVLSYARLMALGLASALLAEVANHLGATLAPRPVGLAAAALLHAVNFTLGLVSPAIAALRLHYVEFFEKFYDEGGRPFRPLGLAA
jgi:V/A-type H+-transporting ATPase subunit I